MLTMGFPSGELARSVESYWEIVGDFDTGLAPYEILPDGNTDLVFMLSSSGATAMLFGPLTRAVGFKIDTRDQFFGIRFRPAQAHRLVDIDQPSLVDRHVVIDRVFGRSVDSLADELRSLPDLASRRRLFEAMQRKASPMVEDERCRRAVLCLQKDNGAGSIRDLADSLAMHRRSLERLFRENLGLSPKTLARLIRLQHVLRCLRRRDFKTYCDLAHACGYAHQSHMIREMKSLTGRLPSALSFAEPSLSRSAQGL